MTVRISSTSSGGTRSVRIEGRLGRSDLADLKRECEMLRRPYHLDLTGLGFVCEEGVRMLRDLVADGSELFGVSPYVKQLLSGEMS